jgi:hypothetical protein
MIDGLPCLDGGLVDNVPIGSVADVPGHTLVLTTRRHKFLAPVFARDGLLYVQPSEKVAASSWDYTSPAKYEETYDLGRRDGDAFLKSFALGRYHEEGLHAASVPRASVGAGGSAGAMATADAGADAHLADGGVADGDVTDGGVADAAATGAAIGGAAVTQAAASGATASGGALAGATVTAAGTALPPGAAAAGAARVRPAATAGDAGRGSKEAKEAGSAAPPVDRNDDRAVVLDVSARLADYREPTEAGIDEDLSASQPAASDGQERSGRSLRASKI